MSRRAKGTYDTVSKWVSDLERRLPLPAFRVLRTLHVRSAYRRPAMRLGDLVAALEQSERTIYRGLTVLSAYGLVVLGPDGYRLTDAADTCAAQVPHKCRTTVSPEARNSRAAQTRLVPEVREVREGREGQVLSFSMSFQTPSLTVNAPRERDETLEVPAAAAQVEQVTSSAREASKPARIAREKVARAPEPIAPLPSRLANTPGFLAAWTDWREHLRAKKKPLTAIAERRQLAKLERSPDPVAMLEHSLANNWQGLFEPDPPRSGRGDPGARGQARADAGMFADYQRTLAALQGIN